MIRRSVLVVVLAAFVALTSTAVASADPGVYVETPCAGKSSDASWDWITPAGFFTSAECPSGYAFYLIEDGQLGDSQSEFSMETQQSQIEGFSARIQRPGDEDSGIELGLQACNHSDCSELVTGTGGADEFVSLSRDEDEEVEIPEGATRIVVRTKCTLLVCPASVPVVVSDLAITRSDYSPPGIFFYRMIKVYEGDPDTTADDIYDSTTDPPKWVNDWLLFFAESLDPESLRDYIRYDVDDVSKCWRWADDSLVIPDCDMFDTDDMPTIRADELEDGHHTLTATAYNLAGLSSDATLEFKTDTTSPERPTQFNITPRFNGWVSSRDAKIQWTNTGETVESEDESGIVGFRYDPAPVFGGENPPPAGVTDPPEKYVSSPGANSLQFRFPSAGEWTVSIVTIDAAGNESEPGEAFLNIEDAKPGAPQVPTIDPINAEDLENGRTISWTNSAVPMSGICGYDHAFNASSSYNPGDDPTSPTIPSADPELNLTTTQVEGLSERPQRFHLRAYSCAGVAGEIAHPQVVVDFTKPKITLAPAGGNFGTDEPVLIGAIDSKPNTIQSGVASVTCEINAEPVDCSTASGVMLVPGDNHLKVTAVDAAGNRSVAEADFVADSDPPVGWFESQDSGDPTLIRAAARDDGTGLATAVIEFQSFAGGPWTRIGSGFSAEKPSKDPVSISARIPDDGQIADGQYRLRMRLQDAGGIKATIDRRPGNEEAAFVVPVRAKSVVTAALSSKSDAKSTAVSRLVVGYGEKVQISGKLTSSSGAPVSGAMLSVSAIQSGTPPRTVAFGTTGADGGYAIPVPEGGTRNLVVRFAGNLVARPTTAEVKLLVTGKVSLSVNRKVVRRGKAVVLSGKVSFAGASLPIRGKAIELAFSTGGSSWKKTFNTDAAGRFAYSYRYPGKRRSVRFSVRAISTNEAGWPFEVGVSPKVKFEVKA